MKIKKEQRSVLCQDRLMRGVNQRSVSSRVFAPPALYYRLTRTVPMVFAPQQQIIKVSPMCCFLTSPVDLAGSLCYVRGCHEADSPQNMILSPACTNSMTSSNRTIVHTGYTTPPPPPGGMNFPAIFWEDERQGQERVQAPKRRLRVLEHVLERT